MEDPSTFTKTFRALNKLAKWRSWFAAWQLGTRSDTDPECKAVKDHREVTLMLRVEINTLTALLLKKKVFTAQEWDDALCKEAVKYDEDLSLTYPGVTSMDNGLSYSPEVATTMAKLNFKP